MRAAGAKVETGAEVSKPFGDAPRMAAALGGGLHIAERHVEADPVAEHVAQGVLGAHVPAAGADCDHDLHLVMEAQGEGWAGHDATVADERGGGLEEEHRGLVAVGAHLARMVAIVAANGHDLAHGERFRVPLNLNPTCHEIRIP